MDTIAPKTPDPLPFAAWRNFTPVETAREVHSRIAALSPALRRAAIAWQRSEAELAAELTAAAGDGRAPLQGIPYLLKDLFDLAGAPTFAGSTFLPEVRPTPARSSRLVDRLHTLGATCAAKTHLVEFASGLTGENPHYGDCPHPRFSDRLSGGSSSGSAALVAAGVAPLGIGTDTGGSVRVPAAWCGLHGFRLTPAQEFITDAFPLAPSFDTAGWFTATATDLLCTWRSLVDIPASSSALAHKPDAFRGVFLSLRDLLPEPDPTLTEACDVAAAAFSAPAPSDLASRLLASWRDAVDAYVTIGMSEAYTVHRNWLVPHRERYDPVIWQRFTDAGKFTSERIKAARATQEKISRDLRDFFQAFDFLVLPAVTCIAPRKSDATPELRRQILTLNAPASLTGLPVLTLPVSLAGGFTAGLQVLLPNAASATVPWLLEGRGSP